jgi:hypothetical protein
MLGKLTKYDIENPAIGLVKRQGCVNRKHGF